MSLEDWGFCEVGESGPFVADGHIRREGKLSVNRTAATSPRSTSRAASTYWKPCASCEAPPGTRSTAPDVALYGSGIGASPGGGIPLRRTQ
jgi:hypothetical protein